MSANTYGRQVVLPLTNKSGGGVIAGDVVIIDTTNNDAFTTTTSAGFTGTVGIAQETIASNAVGRVLVSGYAALVNVNASVTRGNYGQTHTVAKQATDAGASRTVGTFCQFLTGGTTPDAVVYPVDLLGAALSNPMTTKGDIIIADTGGTPTRLAATTSGYVLTAQGAGAFPAWAAAGGGALVLLEQHTASTSATLDFTTFISSTYDEYQIEFNNVLPATNTVQFYMRMGTGGGPTFDAGTNYGWGVVRYNAAGVGGSGVSTGANQIILVGDIDAISNDSNYNGVSGVIRLFSPGAATYKKITGNFAYKSTNMAGTGSSGVYISTTAVTGVQFLFSSGNIASGIIRAYGIAK